MDQQTTYTKENVKAIAALTELKEHINQKRATDRKNGISSLIGHQWIVVEIFHLHTGLTGKIIGTTKEGQTISAPIDYWRTRQYCGIIYHREKWTREAQTVATLNDLAHRHKTTFILYNPYQDKVHFAQ